MESEYLRFDLLGDSPSGKTKRYDVVSKNHGTTLATIAWYGAWRQYVLYPQPSTIWNKGCLSDVAKFLEGLMDARKPKGLAEFPTEKIDG